MKEVILTAENFEKEVLGSEIPVLVDFWATWCGPCKMLAPELEKFAEQADGKVKVGKINVDEQMELAIKYKVEVIPTLMLFKSGQLVRKDTGFMKLDELKQKYL